jgi:hypothetical protein
MSSIITFTYCSKWNDLNQIVLTTDIFLERSKTLYQKYRTCRRPLLYKGKFLSDPKYDFKLEAYANDTPAPNILPEEVDIAQSALFLLTAPEFPSTEVVKPYAHTIVAPAID